MKAQKFHAGDLVHVAKDLGQSMSHFTADVDAIVIGSYSDQYGGSGGPNENYTLHLKGHGQCSWYHESQLTLLERKRNDLLAQWQSEQDADIAMRSDLDWIFANGPAVLKSPKGASIDALAACFGLTDMWGSHGEGFTYHANAIMTMELARRFLRAGDKAGWIAHCEELKASHETR